jgi:hypothetical protein
MGLPTLSFPAEPPGRDTRGHGEDADRPGRGLREGVGGLRGLRMEVALRGSGGFFGEASSANTFWVEALVSKGKMEMLNFRRCVTSPIRYLAL